MRKALEIIKKVFTIAIAVIAVAVMIFTIVSVTTFNRSDRNIFGYKAFIVLSGSMAATDFEEGDLVISKTVDPTTLKEGDIISFTSQDPNSEYYGQTVSHKIRRRTTDANGDDGFITYGTTNNTDDAIIVTYAYINGKYLFHIPKVGIFFDFLKSPPGYIICILIPFVLLIGMQGLNTVKLFRRYRREQMEAMEEERAKLDAERKQSEEMMAELMRLKAQMAAGGEQEEKAEPNSPAPPAPEAAKEVKAEETAQKADEPEEKAEPNNPETPAPEAKE